jgi:hypothetical protein
MLKSKPESSLRDRIVDELLQRNTIHNYPDGDLFDLGLHTRRDTEEYIRTRFYDGSSKWTLSKGKKSGLTRRLNRLWSLLEGPIKRTQKSAGAGIYQVRQGYPAQIIGNLYAETHEEAKRTAELFYGYVTNPSSSWPQSTIVFLKHACVTDLLEMNSVLVEDLNEEILSRKETISRAKAEMQSLKWQIKAIKLLQKHQISVLGP